MKALVLRVHAAKVKALGWCVSPLLLLIRLLWGSQFFMAGQRKLQHLDTTAQFFASLGIPMPKLNAALAGSVEMLGGLCLVIGLGGRVVTFPLIFTMLVAYATAHRDTLGPLAHGDLEPFLTATPFQFLFACVLILVFGSGSLSADYLILKKVAPDEKK
jgi:putative oxidoreductase